MGYLRFSLVFAVIVNHLAPGRQWEGHLAVYGFYMLSGFLITLVTQEVYGNSLLGRTRFLANRFLRIYPTYWACLLVSYGILLLTNDSLKNAFHNVGIPHTLEEWIPNILIYSIANFEPTLFGPRIVTTSWSLSIELVYYLVIGLVVAHSRILMWLCLIASMVNSRDILLYAPNSFDPLYLTVYGPAPLFFTGALLYSYRKYLRRLCTTRLWVLLLITNLVLYAPEMSSELTGFRIREPQIEEISVLYTLAPFLAYTILCAYFRSKEKPISRFEQFVADVSYPMFLLHPILGYGGFFCIEFPYINCKEIRYQDSWWFFGCCVVSTIVGSSLVVFCVDQPMKYYRAHIRNKAAQKHAEVLNT